MKSSWKGTCW